MTSCKTLKGFTLIEVLIAMTMLSIMVVLLFASLKTCADSWEKGERKIAEVNEVAVVYNFFKRHLTTAQPLRIDFTPEEDSFSFQGHEQSVQFVSAFPASAGKAGLQLFSLQLLEDDDGRFIQVSLTPFFPPAKDEEFFREEITLVNHVKAISLTYFGQDSIGNDGVWQNEWVEKDIMPRLVKISIELENGIYWPDMIIDLKIDRTIVDNTDPEAQDADVSEED